jgi:hypothetical protein
MIQAKDQSIEQTQNGNTYDFLGDSRLISETTSIRQTEF